MATRAVTASHGRRQQLLVNARLSTYVTDIGNPTGFDLATVLTGSGLTLLLSAGIMRYGDRFVYSTSELYGISGGIFVVIGVIYGLVLVAKGIR